MQPSGPSSAYGGNYQHPSRSPYGAYGTPAPYQPPNIFLPSQTPSQGAQIRKHIDDTLGSGNLREAVKLPTGEGLNEWLAVMFEGWKLIRPLFGCVLFFLALFLNFYFFVF
ncbi:hypothetical protein RGQ29_032497 [Quercus rubra]|uniref:Uncharacterized protein n=1 Tax=Quercus rubra TaxID=3512 RepID=A0AAN7DWJ6_QUERU|nr:hypothetical protein RGQ29_032497 [Quercus rubra]